MCESACRRINQRYDGSGYRSRRAKSSTMRLARGSTGVGRNKKTLHRDEKDDETALGFFQLLSYAPLKIFRFRALTHNKRFKGERVDAVKLNPPISK